MACVGRKARRGKGRRFRGCVGLVQHARAATRYGRPGAHRALAAVVCRVLGWNIERLPSIVIDPRGTLGQALAAEAAADAQDAKDNDDTEENNGSSSDEDEEKEDVEARMEDSSIVGDEEASELVISKESAGKEDVETRMEDSKSTDGDKEANELGNGKESAEKVNGNRDDSLSQDSNGEVHEQETGKESAEQENANNTYLPSSKDACKNEERCKEAAVQAEVNATESTKDHAETANGNGDTAATRFGNNSSTEGNVDENKDEHAGSTS